MLSKIQNSGAFSTTRDKLSTKFLKTFQFIEFSEFTAEELSQTAFQAAKNKSLNNDKIIDKMSMFHNELIKSEYSKQNPQYYKIRDLNVSIKSTTEGKSSKDVVRCFYGSW